MRTRIVHALSAIVLVEAGLLPAALGAQALTERTPNMSGTWVTSPANLHFQFSHRFTVAGSDASVTDIFGDGKIANYPTFDLAVGLFDGAMAGFRYSSQSIGAGAINEWQPYVKVAPIRGLSGGPVSLALTGAWNGANHSVDGEVALEARGGRVFFMGAVRGFSSIYDLPAGVDDGALALAGGVGLKLNRYLTLTGDVADLVAGPDGDLAWSAGLNLGIPFTPHTISIMATNVTSGTLAGVSTGASTFVEDAVSPIFWGFEFTIPFSGFARWGQILSPDELRSADRSPDRGRVVEIDISGVSYQVDELTVPPGTTVRWVNKDPIAHTVTPDGEESWGSSMIGPGETYEHTFDRSGRFTYHCIPHPFMTGAIVVTG